MGGQVINTGKIAAGRQTHDHKTQLADGRIGPHLLDIPADHRHGRCHQHADGADRQKNQHGGGREAEVRKKACK